MKYVVTVPPPKDAFPIHKTPSESTIVTLVISLNKWNYNDDWCGIYKLNGSTGRWYKELKLERFGLVEFEVPDSYEYYGSMRFGGDYSFAVDAVYKDPTSSENQTIQLVPFKTTSNEWHRLVATDAPKSDETVFDYVSDNEYLKEKQIFRNKMYQWDLTKLIGDGITDNAPIFNNEEKKMENINEEYKYEDEYEAEYKDAGGEDQDIECDECYEVCDKDAEPCQEDDEPELQTRLPNRLEIKDREPKWTDPKPKWSELKVGHGLRVHLDDGTKFDLINPDASPGFIVIHQNVGNLAPNKAEAFCNKVKEAFTASKEYNDFKTRNPNWHFVLLPSRTEKSYVEVFHEDQRARKSVISEIAKIVLGKELPFQHSPELQKKVKDYILLMLGAPVVKIELTDEQLNFCYQHTLNLIHDYHYRIKKFTITESYRAQSTDFFQRGALAHAKVILGRIRMQLGVPQDQKYHIDPKDLYNEGKEELNKWKALLVPGEEVEEEDA